MSVLPAVVQSFVERVSVPAPVQEIDPQFAVWYASWPFRAAAAILLSGRVQANASGLPNMTDANRIGKEAQFHPGYIERVAHFLVRGSVLQKSKSGTGYESGSEAEAFWKLDLDALKRISNRAYTALISEFTGYVVWRPSGSYSARLSEFLTLFFHCFAGRAFKGATIESALLGFAALPREVLHGLSTQLSLGLSEHDCGSWDDWLDSKGQQAILGAIQILGWGRPPKVDPTLFVLEPLGYAMLGLQPLASIAPLPTDLRVLSNLSVFAGAGRSLEDLTTLVRHCKIKRFDRVCEFQLDRKRFRQAGTQSAPAQELAQLFAGIELPDTVSDLLQTKSALVGTVCYRYCSAIIRVSSDEVRAAIRAHPQLKGYLEPKPPPGYLLIKANSNPETFLRRCRDLGLTVDQM